MVSQSHPQECLPIAVVMVPLPIQGHLNPLLHLSAHLASRLISVYYISSSTHNRQARLRLHGWSLSSPSLSSHLHFHDLPFPTVSSPPPSHLPRSFLSGRFQPSFDSSLSHLLPHLSSLLLSLSPSHRRLILLHDSSMSFARSATSPKTEPFSFHPSSAISNLFFLRAMNTSRFGDEFLRWLRRQGPSSPPKGRIFNTCRCIEGEFLDRLSADQAWRGGRLFSVGPLNPVVAVRSEESCLEWLDRQKVRSVVYVSFGTTTTMRKEQLREIAAGLERSGQSFLWVRRDADRCDIFETGAHVDDEEDEDVQLAEFEERVKGKSMVVRGWAPQLEILAHPSTGGFLSHCGWNSCMEAMSNGVPILAWPMHSDQPTNAALVTEILRTGMAVGEWSERDELVAASAVKEAVEKLMVGGEGAEVRKKAREIGESLRAAAADGGSSKEDLEAFVSYICRP